MAYWASAEKTDFAILSGFLGSDDLDGWKGNDELRGGSGNDESWGHDGSDRIIDVASFWTYTSGDDDDHFGEDDNETCVWDTAFNQVNCGSGLHDEHDVDPLDGTVISCEDPTPMCY